MAGRRSSQQSFHVVTDELIAQVTALAEIGDQTGDLVSSAQRLAGRDLLLGTAPPAMHLALRLREAAGPAGLAGEVSAADAELTSYHQALRDTVHRYQDRDDEVTSQLRGKRARG